MTDAQAFIKQFQVFQQIFGTIFQLTFFVSFGATIWTNQRIEKRF